MEQSITDILNSSVDGVVKGFAYCFGLFFAVLKIVAVVKIFKVAVDPTD